MEILKKDCTAYALNLEYARTPAPLQLTWRMDKF